ncbi:PQQ-binding-like beta-propeller repeat protein [Natronococcus sp. A-GB1]|uniref:outer membrane protein assembly factor BamB family protein n=1 Tax=Natronococcus sp. A-GB1 TaxID=3037648 RepID=UPI00241C530A|nr:PQQ-binding-like beta-propeller repeat protein [Natronococcus sp. A-GB1]MDG5757743.1 PQQ-binding-like beta-propeller repeat protein [Natronococcus sp. A-GB1]
MRSRRDVLLGTGAAGTAALAGCLGSTDAEPGSDDDYTWSTPGADIGNSRTVADGAAPREEPSLEWGLEFDSAFVTAEPIVTDDTVLVTTGTDVVAVDCETGERRWSIDPDNDAYTYNGAPTVVGDRAYLQEVDTLTARDLETGEIEWSHEFDSTIGTGSVTVSETDDGRIYAAAGDAVHALEAGTGDHLWEQELLGVPRYAIAKYADSLYVATRGGELYDVDRWGTVEWRRTIEAGIASAPVVLTSEDRRTGHGVAVAGNGGTITYFDIGGNREWETELGGSGTDGLAIGHRTLLARSGSTLYALDANEGGERWRVSLERGGSGPPIVVGDTVYVGDDRLRAIDIDGGVGIRSFRVGERRFERETDGDVGFVTAADGKLFATTDAGWEGDGSAKLLVLS